MGRLPPMPVPPAPLSKSLAPPRSENNIQLSDVQAASTTRDGEISLHCILVKSCTYRKWSLQISPSGSYALGSGIVKRRARVSSLGWAPGARRRHRRHSCASACGIRSVHSFVVHVEVALIEGSDEASPLLQGRVGSSPPPESRRVRRRVRVTPRRRASRRSSILERLSPCAS